MRILTAYYISFLLWNLILLIYPHWQGRPVRAPEGGDPQPLAADPPAEAAAGGVRREGPS